MWSDRKPWWQKKSKENQTDSAVKKTWCVIRVGMFKNSMNSFNPRFVVCYKPCQKLNAPKWIEDGQTKDAIAVDNLTKHEAYCVAKGLNFLDGETNDK